LTGKEHVAAFEIVIFCGHLGEIFFAYLMFHAKIANLENAKIAKLKTRNVAVRINNFNL